MNILKQFVAGLGQQNAPFGFAPDDPNASYRQGLSYIGDIGAGLMANNQPGVNPWANLGASLQQAKQSGVQRNKEAYTAQRLMEEAAEKKRQREEETKRNEQWESYVSTVDPKMQGLARMFPEQFGKGLIDKEFATSELPAAYEEYLLARDGGYGGSFVDWKTLNKAGTTVNVNGDMKLTEGQSKDVGYYARGAGANKELDGLEDALLDPASAVGGAVPVVGNWLKDPKFRLAERSAREFLAIVLRKDTGAAVTQQEFDLYGPMYLPMPGDQPSDVKAKNVARRRVLQAIKRGSGTARPLYDDIDSEIGTMSGDVAGDGAIPAPDGWDPEDWKYLTPEEQQKARNQ